MGTTIILYIGVLIVLAGATAVLVLRDLAAGRDDEQVEKGPPALERLPLAGEQPPARNFSNRIDQRFRTLIYQSGLEISPEPAFLVLIFFGLLVGGGLFLWRDDLLVGVFGMVVGMLLPLAYFIRTRTTRLNTIREQLPDAMDLMARAVRAGETMDQAVDSVGKNAEQPLKVEFRRCARHLDMGLSVPGALRSLTKRAPLIELRILTAALSVQRRTGGNLATILERSARVIRDRLSYHRQFMAATGASRMATILIALAGPLVFSYMLIFQADYMGQFFVLPGGWTLLTVAVVLQLIGLTWIIGLLRNDY